MGWFTSKKDKDKKRQEAEEKKQKEEDEAKKKDEEGKPKDGAAAAEDAAKADTSVAAAKSDGAAADVPAASTTTPPQNAPPSHTTSKVPTPTQSPAVQPAQSPAAAPPPVPTPAGSEGGSVLPSPTQPRKVVMAPPGAYPHHHHHHHQAYNPHMLHSHSASFNQPPLGAVSAHQHHMHVHHFPPGYQPLIVRPPSSGGPPATSVPPSPIQQKIPMMRPPQKFVVPPGGAPPTPRGEAGEHQQHTPGHPPPPMSGMKSIVFPHGTPTVVPPQSSPRTALPPNLSQTVVIPKMPPGHEAPPAAPPVATPAAPASPSPQVLTTQTPSPNIAAQVIPSQSPPGILLNSPPAATQAIPDGHVSKEPSEAGSDDTDAPQFVAEDEHEEAPAKQTPPLPSTAVAEPRSPESSESASFAETSTEAPPDPSAKSKEQIVSPKQTSHNGLSKPEELKLEHVLSSSATPSIKQSPTLPPKRDGNGKAATAVTETKFARSEDRRGGVSELSMADSAIIGPLASHTARPDSAVVNSSAAALSNDTHLKTLIKDRFARLLCPQQYFGRIVKVHNVRTLLSRPQPLVSNHMMVAYAVREQTEANHLLAHRSFEGLVNDGSHKFSAQLQLDPKSCRRTANGSHRITTFVLCEIPAARVRFAETTSDALGILDSCDSCFITEDAAYVVCDLATVKPHALIDVTWTLYSDDAPPMCPHHHTPLQLFEPRTRELLCALCTANDMARGDCVVLNDMFSGPSLRSIQHSLNDRHDLITQRLRAHVTAHRTAASSSDRRRQALDLQFSLVQAALNAKRAELHSIFDEEDRARDSITSRAVFTDNEVRRHVNAALTHIRDITASADLTSTDQTLKAPFAQMATVVSSLGHLDSAHSEPIPSLPLQTAAPLDDFLKVSMEHVVRTINDVSFGHRGVSPGRTRAAREPVESPFRRTRSPGLALTYPANSPMRRVVSPAKKAARVVRVNRNPTELRIVRTPSKKDSSPTRVRSAHASPMRSRASSGRYVTTPLRASEGLSRMASRTGHFLAATASANSLGPNGSLLFDIEVNRLVSNGIVEWKLRIDDPGSWIGLGVGVGDDFNALANSASCDTRHLWIAPTNVPRFVKLRVAIGPHKHAKLTVHDAIGRQLDDNRIPHWNMSKLAYPQVSFGEVPGSVTLMDVPHVLPHPSVK
jgi:hypothetical protein